MGNNTSSVKTTNDAGCFSGLFDRDSRLAPNLSMPAEAAQQLSVERRRKRNVTAPIQLRNRAAAAMFESAQNTQIHGGNFTAQHGPHATLTVNINNGPSGNTSVRYQAGDQDQRINPPVNRPLPDIPPEENSRNDHLIRPPTTGDEHRRLLEAGTQPFQKSNELYEQHLLQKGRGHPLWIPQPNIRLPTSYRVKGVGIGDVGIITPDGSFDFLFNICLPATDPIHSDELPEGFVPIDPPLSQRDVREFKEFTNGSYLASSSVSKVQHSHTESRVLAFESSASEGAILTMPEGAYKEELNNIFKFRNHVAIHAESWYKFVNGPCGREAQNGDLRVVVGCDKTTYWGMATFYNLFQQTNFRLNYVARHSENGQHVPGDMYSWEHSGTAEVRVGPGPEETDELTSETTHSPLRNQCLFLRTLTVTLSDALWQDLHRSLGLDVSLNPPLPPINDVSLDSSRTSEQSRVQPQRTSSYSSKGAQGSQHSQHHPSSFAVRDPGDVIIHHSLPSPPTVHPAKLINKFLLKAVPEAKIAITSDRDWYFISPLNVSMLSDRSRLIPRICETSDIYISDGVVYLEPKGFDLRILHPEMVSPVHELINGTISVGEYLFSRSPTHRYLLLEHLQSRLLEDFIVDNKLTLREYVKLQSSSTASLSIVGALQNLLVRTSSGSLEITPRPGSTLLNDKTQKAHLEGHPHRLVSLDEVIHSVRMSLSKAGSLPIQPILPETIRVLRARLSIYSTSTVVRCQVPYLLKLAHALFSRYLQNQQRDDLDEAICYYEEASMSMTPIASYRHVEALLGLCSSLYQRLLLTGRFEDLVDLVKGLEAQADIDYAELLRGESMSSKNAQRQSSSNSAEPYAKFWDDESTESLILSLQEQVQPLIVVPPEQVQSFPVIITSELRQLMNVESRATNLIYLSNAPDVDIKRYLVDCFRKIREAHPRRAALPVGDWPEDHQVNTLVKLSSGNFIYPVTAMRYVSSPHHIPTDRLLEVLTNAMLGGGLKALYSMIINKIENFFEVSRLLGFIAISGRDFCPTPRRLEEQLFLNQGDVRRLILDLDPFVEFVDEETPIRFWHPSFSNFLLGPASPIGHYVDPGVMHKEFAHLCIRHLKRFHESGRDWDNYLASVEYSVVNITEHLVKAELQDGSLRIEIFDLPYVQCLLKWTPGTKRVHRPDQLFCQFLLALKNSRFYNKDELYMHHRRIWDEAVRDRLAKSPLDFGLTLCLTLVAAQWSIMDPLETLKHISAIHPSQRHEDIYPFGLFLYCLSEDLSWPHGWRPEDQYRQLLLDFLFDSARSGPYYLDQSKFTIVAKALIDFIVRPWDDGKRSIRDSKAWENILLIFSQILKHIGYKEELMEALRQTNFLFRLPFTKESEPEMSKHIMAVIAGIEEYVGRNGTGRSTDVLQVLIRDESEKTLAEFHGNKNVL